MRTQALHAPFMVRFRWLFVVQCVCTRSYDCLSVHHPNLGWLLFPTGNWSFSEIRLSGRLSKCGWTSEWIVGAREWDWSLERIHETIYLLLEASSNQWRDKDPGEVCRPEWQWLVMSTSADKLDSTTRGINIEVQYNRFSFSETLISHNWSSLTSRDNADSVF